MAKRSILVGLALVAILGGCSGRPAGIAYTTPGWYLERPRLLLVNGPEIFAGPFTYDHCEAERMKFDATTAQRLICILEKSNPGHFGPFSGTVT
ncbi:MAG TPA: hypothetical protein VLA02_16015 [Reyranella sp.]|nr:hypothetical protein [Reyranella sp.]